MAFGYSMARIVGLGFVRDFLDDLLSEGYRPLLFVDVVLG
jgi:phosphoribosylaminoimidazole (AIR) synthetase